MSKRNANVSATVKEWNGFLYLTLDVDDVKTPHRTDFRVDEMNAYILGRHVPPTSFPLPDIGNLRSRHFVHNA